MGSLSIIVCGLRWNPLFGSSALLVKGAPSGPKSDTRDADRHAKTLRCTCWLRRLGLSLAAPHPMFLIFANGAEEPNSGSTSYRIRPTAEPGYSRYAARDAQGRGRGCGGHRERGG